MLMSQINQAEKHRTRISKKKKAKQHSTICSVGHQVTNTPKKTYCTDSITAA